MASKASAILNGFWLYILTTVVSDRVGISSTIEYRCNLCKCHCEKRSDVAICLLLTQLLFCHSVLDTESGFLDRFVYLNEMLNQVQHDKQCVKLW